MSDDRETNASASQARRGQPAAARPEGSDNGNRNTAAPAQAGRPAGHGGAAADRPQERAAASRHERRAPSRASTYAVWAFVVCLFVLVPLASAGITVWKTMELSRSIEAKLDAQYERFQEVKAERDKLRNELDDLKQNLPRRVKEVLEPEKGTGERLVRVKDMPPKNDFELIKTTMNEIKGKSFPTQDQIATAVMTRISAAKIGVLTPPGPQSPPPPNSPAPQVLDINALTQLFQQFLNPMREQISRQKESVDNLTDKIGQALKEINRGNRRHDVLVVVCRGRSPDPGEFKPQLQQLAENLRNGGLPKGYRLGIVEAVPSAQGNSYESILKPADLDRIPAATDKRWLPGEPYKVDLKTDIVPQELPRKLNELNEWFPTDPSAPPKVCVLLVSPSSVAPQRENRHEWKDFAAVHVVMAVSPSEFKRFQETGAPGDLEPVVSKSAADWLEFCTGRQGVFQIVEAPSAVAGGMNVKAQQDLRRALYRTTSVLAE